MRSIGGETSCRWGGNGRNVITRYAYRSWRVTVRPGGAWLELGRGPAACKPISSFGFGRLIGDGRRWGARGRARTYYYGDLWASSNLMKSSILVRSPPISGRPLTNRVGVLVTLRATPSS